MSFCGCWWGMQVQTHDLEQGEKPLWVILGSVAHIFFEWNGGEVISTLISKGSFKFY